MKIDEDGSKKWYLNGVLHREDGPAIEESNGDKAWWFHGKLHREDGPAVQLAGGTKAWYLNGKLHREDGPAVEGSNSFYAGSFTSWWYNDIKIDCKTQEEFLKLIKLKSFW